MEDARREELDRSIRGHCVVAKTGSHHFKIVEANDQTLAEAIDQKH